MRYFDRIYLVAESLKAATPSEVADTAARLGLTFPDGYAEYVTELGEGWLSDDLQIWLPQEVEDQLPEYRQFFSEHFFWDEDSPLTPARAGEAVMLGHTLDGDSLVFHPDRPDDLFVLPRHDDQVYRVGPGLDAAIDWLCDSGVLTRPKTLRYFEPHGDRERIAWLIPLPYQVVREALVGLGLHDHVAFEVRTEDREKVFDVMIKVGEEYQEVNAEHAKILLLIKDIGGHVTVMNGPLFAPQSTRVFISHVAGPASTKLDRLMGQLAKLEGRGGRRKRRKR